MIGIYKITSPTGRVYVGQSINIEKRFNVYRLMHCKIQIVLYNSFLKHGVENHVFEVIEQCSIKKLNWRERYWQDFYNVTGENGLNCFLTKSKSRTGKMSEECKIKIGLAHKGKVVSEETKEKIKISIKNRVPYKMSAETYKIIAAKNAGKKRTKEQRMKLSLARNPLKILDSSDNKIYSSLREVSFIFDEKYSKLKNMLTGKQKNTTTFSYIRP